MLRSLLAPLLFLALPVFVQASERSALWKAHQADTVEWRNWSPELSEEAKQTEKPLFFFVAHFGNSLARAMLNETFLNKTIAQTVNETTIPVLVDANEMPEFAAFLGRLASEHFEANGLPVCIWTNADFAPLNGGGYFPPTDDWGGQGFLSLARNVSEQWTSARDEFAQAAQARLAQSIETAPLKADLAETLSYIDLEQIDSPTLQATKLFAIANALDQLPEPEAQRYEEALAGFIHRIALSAGFDSVSGGFFVGSNDMNWHLPLFQKSTVDQALMIEVLATLHKRNPKPEYADLIRLTVGFVERDLLKANGLAMQYFDSFAAGESPESTEGTYYTIVEGELGRIPESAKSSWSLSPEGNLDEDTDILGLYTGHNIPRISDLATLSEAADQDRSQLLAIRSKKTKPASDNTGYVATNALLARALAKAYQATSNTAYLETAEKLMAAIETNCMAGGELRNSDTKAHPGSTQAYAFFISANLAIHQASDSSKFLDTAKENLSTVSKSERIAADTFSLAMEPSGAVACLQDTAFPSAVGIQIENQELLQTGATLTPSTPAAASYVPDNYLGLLLATQKD